MLPSPGADWFRLRFERQGVLATRSREARLSRPCSGSAAGAGERQATTRSEEQHAGPLALPQVHPSRCWPVPHPQLWSWDEGCPVRVSGGHHRPQVCTSLSQHLCSRMAAAVLELGSTGRGTGEISAFLWGSWKCHSVGLGEGMLWEELCRERGVEGLQTVVWSAQVLLPWEDRAGGFGWVWVHLMNQTRESPAGHPEPEAVLEKGSFKLK